MHVEFQQASKFDFIFTIKFDYGIKLKNNIVSSHEDVVIINLTVQCKGCGNISLTFGTDNFLEWVIEYGSLTTIPV